MKFTKKLSCLMAATALLAATSAFAVVTPVTVDNVEGLVGSFDWKPGNALGVKAIPVQQGNNFQLFYQATLSNFLDTNGAVITNNGGLNSTYEVSTIASFGETVTGAVGGTAVFGLNKNAPSYIKMYVQPHGTANDLAGTGFDAGQLVLSGHVESMYGSVFTTAGQQGLLDQNSDGNQWGDTTSVYGSGGTSVVFKIDTYDKDYIKGIYNLVLRLENFNTSNNLPFDQVNPAFAMADGFALVTGDTIPTIPVDEGFINGLYPTNILFQADGISSFSAVPEPSTVILMGLGLAGLAGLRYRKARK